MVCVFGKHEKTISKVTLEAGESHRISEFYISSISLSTVNETCQSGDKVSLFLKAPFLLMLTVITEGYPLNGAAMIIDIY